MKDYLLELVAKQPNTNAKVNTMREYLQAYILRILRDEGLFRSTAFVGGTALRFLHNLPRFSEDLDFSSARACSGARAVDFAALVRKIKDELLAAGYNAGATYNDSKTVRSAFLRFSGLLFDAGVSNLREQKFSVKIEIDTNPPDGATLTTSIVNKYFPLAFLSYDIASLFSGKLHALLCREYAKGRDYFDLGWYLSKWRDITPNIALLVNALKQTKWDGALPTQTSWRRLIAAKVEALEWSKVKQDVASFLENPSDVATFTKENVLKLIGG
jgi:predicted nucleotidyltransferase component of viral defense system